MSELIIKPLLSGGFKIDLNGLHVDSLDIVNQYCEASECEISKKEYQSIINSYVKYDYKPFCVDSFCLNLIIFSKNFYCLEYFVYLFNKRINDLLCVVKNFDLDYTCININERIILSDNEEILLDKINRGIIINNENYKEFYKKFNISGKNKKSQLLEKAKQFGFLDYNTKGGVS